LTNPPPAKKVNHTLHCHQSSQSSSSYHPSYQHPNSCSEHQPNYHRYPSSYYQSNNYTSATSQSHSTQPAITYPPPPLQLTYPTANTQIGQPKAEPNTLPPPLAQHPESSQQSNNFPTFRTIHPHNHRRLQSGLPKQMAETRILPRS
jgi:hypothetical protein